VERTLKLFLTFFLKKKIQTQETGRPFVPVPFFMFLRGRFCKFFWFNRTSKISAVEGVSGGLGFSWIFTAIVFYDPCGSSLFVSMYISLAFSLRRFA
jgi:hypothetical protein